MQGWPDQVRDQSRGQIGAEHAVIGGVLHERDARATGERRVPRDAIEREDRERGRVRGARLRSERELVCERARDGAAALPFVEIAEDDARRVTLGAAKDVAKTRSLDLALAQAEAEVTDEDAHARIANGDERFEARARLAARNGQVVDAVRQDVTAHVDGVAETRSRSGEDPIGVEGAGDELGLRLEDLLKTDHVGVRVGENPDGAIEIAPKVHADALLDVPAHDAQIRHT